MPLTNAATVERDGGLIWQLFQPVGITDQAGLDTLVTEKIVVADYWLQRRLGSNYNLPFASAQAVQAQAESYITLHYLVPILQACKVYGTNYPIWSEESENYSLIVQRDWREEALALVDEWITLENMAGGGFALPYFGITQPVPILEDGTNGLDPLIVLYEEALARARGFSNLDTGTVIR